MARRIRKLKNLELGPIAKGGVSALRADNASTSTIAKKSDPYGVIPAGSNFGNRWYLLPTLPGPVLTSAKWEPGKP